MFRLLLVAMAVILLRCLTNPYRDGEILYKIHCAGCHLDDGGGLGALIPPLAGSDFLTENRERLPCIVRYGLKDTTEVNGVIYTEPMAAIPVLSDIDVANVLNYVQARWGNPKAVYGLDEVREMLKKCEL